MTQYAISYIRSRIQPRLIRGLALLRCIRKPLITIISVADDPEIRDRTYEILHLGCGNRHRTTGPAAG